MSSEPRSEALQALSQFLVVDSTLGDALQRIAEITLDATPSANMAGVTMLDSLGRPSTTVFTDPGSPEIDSGQYEDRKGPCLDAWRTKQVVRIPDMEEAASVYPRFAEKALAHGVHSTLSLPLVAADKGVGALNLYSPEHAGFSAQEVELGIDLVAAASTVLANATAYWQAFELSEHLSQAMKSRAVIEQAKGILMAQSDVDADTAFDMLVRTSQRENVKLRDVAQRIVDVRARRPSPS